MPGHADSIREYITSELGVPGESIADNTPLFSTGGLDSFALVDLLAFVEGLTGRKFRIVDVNLDNLDSIDQIVAFVEGQDA